MTESYNNESTNLPLKNSFIKIYILYNQKQFYYNPFGNPMMYFIFVGFVRLLSV